MRRGPCLTAPRRRRPPYGGTAPSCTTHSNTRWNSGCSTRTPLRRLNGRHRRQSKRLRVIHGAWIISIDCYCTACQNERRSVSRKNWVTTLNQTETDRRHVSYHWLLQGRDHQLGRHGVRDRATNRDEWRVAYPRAGDV